MNDLGDVLFATPVWAWGRFHDSVGRKFRIYDMLELPEQEKPDLRLGGDWVVEPAD